jgi:hypothetical protein
MNRTLSLSLLLILISNFGISQFAHHESFSWDAVYNNALLPIDTDDDGDIDFIVSGMESGPRFIENIGDDLYERPVYLTDKVPSYSELKQIDLEGDGDPDFIGMRGSVGEIISFQNEGGNVFSETPIYAPGGSYYFDLNVVDMDNDGDQDVTFRSGSVAVYWLENDGTGDFTLHSIFTDGFSISNYLSFDGDGDGDLDVCIYETGPSTLSYYENLDGTFAAAVILLDAGGWVSNLISFDHDEDGDNDLYFSQAGNVKLFENLGDAVFASPITFAPINANSLFPFTDIDGDGLQDFVAYESWTAQISWKRNLGAGIFEALEPMVQTLEPATAIKFKDIDLDGKEDLIHIAYAGSMVYYKNLDDGAFSDAVYFSETAVIPSWTHSCDIDNDGDLDLLCSAYWDNRITWVENLGDGTFSQIRTVVAQQGLSPVYVNSSDIDGDGFDDILGISQSSRSFWVKNMGDGTFGDPVIISEEFCAPTSIIAEDWDGDGDNDVVVAVGTESFIKLYENIDGDISPTGILLVTDYVSNPVSSHDLDGDGDFDILYASNYYNTMRWLENTGDFSFTLHDIGDDLVYILQNNASDMDGDGDLDVILASPSENSVAWIENLGDGLFSGTNVITTDCIDPTTVSHTDINNDGIGDLIVGSTGDKMISWFPGLATDEAIFGPREILIDSIQDVECVLIEDLDLDGDNDIVYVASWEWIWSWYENLYVIDDNSIDENSENNIMVYPNPFTDNATIKFGEELKGEHTIVIYDILGAEVYRRTNITAQQIQISNSDIGRGLYFLSVLNGDGKRVLTAKLIAE